MTPRMCLTERDGVPVAVRIDGDMDSFMRCLEASDRAREDEALADKLASMDGLWDDLDETDALRDRLIELERDGNAAVARLRKQMRESDAQYRRASARESAIRLAEVCVVMISILAALYFAIGWWAS